MVERINEPTTLRMDCAECPLAPGLRFDMLDLAVSMTLQQVTDGTTVWRRGELSDPVEITVSLADDKLRLRRPRAVELRLPAGEPSEPGTYKLVGEMAHDSETVRWPAEPERIEFEQ